jgi:hypothetical protein
MNFALNHGSGRRPVHRQAMLWSLYRSFGALARHVNCRDYLQPVDGSLLGIFTHTARGES